MGFKLIPRPRITPGGSRRRFHHAADLSILAVSIKLKIRPGKEAAEGVLRYFTGAELHATPAGQLPGAGLACS